MENNIKKLFAVISERKYIHDKDTAAICKVYIIEENDKKNYDLDYIKEVFPLNGNIFSGKIFIDANAILLQKNDFIEIILDEIIPKSEDSQNTFIKHQPVKKVGVKIIDIPFDIANNDFLDLQKTNDFFNSILVEKETLGTFYLSDSQYVFGPFKIEKFVVCPRYGKSVFKYEFNIDELIDIENSHFSYLLEEPKEKVAELDCMSKIQILEYLKTTLKSFHDINLEVNKIKEINEALLKNNFGREGLNAIRLSRASQYLSELEFSFEELNKIKTYDESWNSVFTENYQKHKEEFENEFLTDVETVKKIKEKELDTLLKEITLTENTVLLKNRIFDEISAEIEQINIKKEDLILSIKLSAGINELRPKLNTENETINYYLSDEKSNTELPIYEDCDDYLDDLIDDQIIIKEDKNNFIDAISSLKKGNFIIASNIAFVTTLVQTFGAYKLIQQNTEIDWIKYDYIFKNGLKEIAKDAIQNPIIPHFYILQDINISSFECYAKPIIDIANGVRKEIPGLRIDWPSNLFFIGIPIEIEIDDFGFEIQRETFKNWKALPYIQKFLSSNSINMNHRVDINSIQVNHETGEHFEKYFS